MISTIINRWRAWRSRRARERRLQRDGCLCICPHCHEDADAPSAWAAAAEAFIYHLTCPYCGRVSRWLFDAPVPLLITPHPKDTRHGDHQDQERHQMAAR